MINLYLILLLHNIFHHYQGHEAALFQFLQNYFHVSPQKIIKCFLIKQLHVQVI